MAGNPRGPPEGVDSHIYTRADLSPLPPEDPWGKCNKINRNVFFYEDADGKHLYQHDSPSPFFQNCGCAGGCSSYPQEGCFLPTSNGIPRMTEVDLNLIYHFDESGEFAPDIQFQKNPSCQISKGFGEWQGTLGYDLQSRRENPLFCDSNNHNYKLKPDSPALLYLGFQPIDFGNVGVQDNLFQ